MSEANVQAVGAPIRVKRSGMRALIERIETGARRSGEPEVRGRFSRVPLRDVEARGVDIPYQATLMLPYVLTLLVLAFGSRSVGGPADLGQAYRRESR